MTDLYVRLYTHTHTHNRPVGFILIRIFRYMNVIFQHTNSSYLSGIVINRFTCGHTRGSIPSNAVCAQKRSPEKINWRNTWKVISRWGSVMLSTSGDHNNCDQILQTEWERMGATLIPSAHNFPPPKPTSTRLKRKITEESWTKFPTHFDLLWHVSYFKHYLSKLTEWLYNMFYIKYTIWIRAKFA